MIHTLGLIIKLESDGEFEEYKSILKAYCSKNKGKFFPDPKNQNEYLMDATKGSGVIWSLAKHSKGKIVLYYLKAKVNPGVLLYNDYINPISGKDIDDFLKKFDKLSKEVSENMPLHNDYTIHRIDYCVNLHNKKIHKKLTEKKLMKLIRCSDKPRGYKEYKKYDKKAKKTKSPDNGLYLINNKVNGNSYIKHEQLKDYMEKGKIPDDIPIKKAKGIIRFEVQCKPSKVKLLREKYDMDKNDFSSLLSAEMCEEILKSYFSKIIGPGDYYTIQAAKNMVNDCDYTENEKKEMIKALELVSKKRSIWKSRESLDKKSEIKSFNEALDSLRQLGINPVTLPRDWKVDSIPSLERYILKEIKK